MSNDNKHYEKEMLDLSKRQSKKYWDKQGEYMSVGGLKPVELTPKQQIQKLVDEAEVLIRQAEGIADDSGEAFGLDIAYGMGGWYSSGEWQSSTSMC